MAEKFFHMNLFEPNMSESLPCNVINFETKRNHENKSRANLMI